jgi:hypothetical protein
MRIESRAAKLEGLERMRIESPKGLVKVLTAASTGRIVSLECSWVQSERG